MASGVDVDIADPPGTDRSAQLAERAALAASVVLLLAVAATRVRATALWYDEAWSLAAVDHPGVSLSSTGGTMGLYYVLLWVWGRVSADAWWLRLFSTACAAGTLALVRSLGRLLGGPRLACLAPLLLVASPMFLWKATEARGYALETLLTTAAWYALVRALHHRQRAHRDARAEQRWWGVFTALLVAGPMAHGLFGLQAAAMALVLLVDSRRSRVVGKVVPGFVGLGVVTAVLMGLGSNVVGATEAGTPWQLYASAVRWYLSPVLGLGQALLALTVVGVALALRAARRSPGGQPRLLVLVPVAWVVVPEVLAHLVRLLHTVYTDYYVSPIAPGVALLLGATALRLVDTVAARRATPAVPAARSAGAAVAVAGVLAVALAVLNQFPQARYPDERWQDAARLVASRARSTDGIVFAGVNDNAGIQDRGAFEAAWREVRHPAVPRPISPERPLGSVRRKDTYLAPEVVRQRLGAYDRVWFVDYTNALHDLDLTDRPPIAGGYDAVVDEWFSGGIHVLLYERSGTSH